jgi:hypothetical protein
MSAGSNSDRKPYLWLHDGGGKKLLLRSKDNSVDDVNKKKKAM